MANIKIAHIVAYDTDGGIGIGDFSLPWKLPSDLKHFKELTRYHPVIMGRKTFESIGRPLHERFMIVISRETTMIPGCVVANNIEDAVAIAFNQADRFGLERVFVIGGAEIYKQTASIADEVFATEVDGMHGTDRFYQLPNGLTLVEQSSIQHENNTSFVFKRYLRESL